jgi:hypothetical protein
LAHLVSTALKGQDPAREKRPDDIIRAEVGLLLGELDVIGDPLGFLVILGVMEPIGHGQRPGHIFRKIDKVFRTSVPDIEKGFLPSPDRF